MKVITVMLKWIARGASIAAILGMVMYMSGENIDPRIAFSSKSKLFIFFPYGVLLGMLVSWKWEGIGGAISIICLITFYIIDYTFYTAFPGGNGFLILSSPAFLFIFYSIMTYNTRHRNAYL